MITAKLPTATRPTRGYILASCILAACILTACTRPTLEADYPDPYEGATAQTGSVFTLFGLKGAKPSPDASPDTSSDASSSGGAEVRGLAVNADLWRAALETISFMPLLSADPYGGTIITDWYNDPGQPGERVKLDLVISGLELRADAVRVSLFREKQVAGRWVGVAASSAAERQLENIVLSKARDFVMARRRNR